MVNDSPIASMLNDIERDNAASFGEYGSRERVKRAPEEDMVMRVITGTIHEGLTFARSLHR